MNRFEGKNILFIYYKFPPIKGIGTLRNLKFYQSLKQVARKVYVATTSNRRFLPTDQFRYEEKDVIEIPTCDFRTIYHFLTGEQGSLLVSRDRSPHRWLPEWKAIFQKSLVSRYFDEGGSYFVYRGVGRCQRIIEEENIDTIVSSYMPFDAHRLAYRLKQKFPHLYWIADYRDFFSDPMLRSRPGFSQRQDRHVKILSKVDEVTTVSRGIQERLLPFHPNVHVVRNGIHDALMVSKPVPRYKLFTISYTGSIYPDAQDAEILASVIRELVIGGLIHKNQLQFINAGKDGLYWKRLLERYQLGDILVNKGIVSHEKSLVIQRKSHLNVLLSWATEDVSGILTGKLFEYLASGTPIVAIVKGIHDPELHELISENGKGEVFYPTVLGRSALKKYLLQRYQAWQKTEPDRIGLYDTARTSMQGVVTWKDEFSVWSGVRTSGESDHRRSSGLTS